MKKGLSILFLASLVLVMLSLVVACDNKSTPPHEHTFADKLIHNETYHWYPATCEHTDEVKDKAMHTWDEGEETTPAGYGAVGEMTYKCTECDGTKTEPISALDAKDCSVAFESDYNPSRAYNGTEIVIHKAKIIRKDANGDTIVTPEDDIVLEFKKKTDETYSAEAPKNVGEYTVKVTVKGSAEWKECSTTLDFKIPQRILTLKSGKDLVFEFNNESTFAIGIEDVFDGFVTGETPIDLVVEFNGKTAGSTYKSHNLLIKSSNQPATNYVLAGAVETKLKSVKISPKPIILSGEYCFWAVEGAELKINFIIPSGLSDNAVLKMNLNRSGKTWELGKEYTINSSEYPVSWYEPAPNYVPMLADGGIKVAIKKGSGPTLTVGTEHNYTTDADGCIIAFFGTLGNLKRYRIEVKTEAGVSVPYNKMTLIGKQTTYYPLTMNIQNINSNGEFVFYGVSNQTSTLYVKGEPNSTYKVKIIEIT